MKFGKKIGLSFLLLTFLTLATGCIGLLFIYRVLNAFGAVSGSGDSSTGELAGLNRHVHEAIMISQEIAYDKQLEDILELRKEFTRTLQEFDRSFNRIRKGIEDEMYLGTLESFKTEQNELKEQTHELIGAIVEELQAENAYRHALAISEQEWFQLVIALRKVTESLAGPMPPWETGGVAKEGPSSRETAAALALRPLVSTQQLLMETRLQLKTCLSIEDPQQLPQAAGRLEALHEAVIGSANGLAAPAGMESIEPDLAEVQRVVRLWANSLLGRQELLVRVREEHPEVPVVIITGNTDVATAVACMKMGTFDYLVKTIEESKLIATVSRAVELRELRRENISLRNHLVRQNLEHPEVLSGIVFHDDRMKAVLMYVESIARSNQTVLITGETGTGKEVIARAIHDMSGRKGNFVAVNIAGLDDTMFSDTLFGHVKGAYTGASQERKGLIGTAAAGTLFLDEIGDLSIKSQVNLLRLLETREYYPLGSDLARRTDARIIMATNQDVRKAIAEGRFRRDLFFRLQTHHVQVPPLRDRPGDLQPLADHFFQEACAEYGREANGISREVYSLLRRCSFPGNIRELRSLIFDAVSQHRGGELSPESFKQSLGGSASLAAEVHEEEPLVIGAEFPTLKQATGFLIEEALRRSGGNQAAAARLLGISPPALSRRLSREQKD
jgi:two-component system nitrogen regulation response regulator GlnG